MSIPNNPTTNIEETALPHASKGREGDCCQHEEHGPTKSCHTTITHTNAGVVRVSNAPAGGFPARTEGG